MNPLKTNGIVKSIIKRIIKFNFVHLLYNKMYVFVNSIMLFKLIIKSEQFIQIMFKSI